MSYTVLARRYRSRGFDELIGQEPIARTLKNAIATGRTAHAYLFCGTRGVGKTSLARIFAKELNVSDDLAEAASIAEAVLRGDDLDVIEIDGASNRGIQEARELIAGSGLSPSRCRYKIYIIDEVHALTRDAFNALLKTMEEPPSHVKFILCTTDPMKVPATIQSRCQRFDFRAIPTTLIAEQLARILEMESLEADAAVVNQVARLGNGSMRDALSLLDRVIAASDGRLSREIAEEVLGLPNHELIGQVMQAVVDADPATALTLGSELLAGGATVDQVFEMIAEHLRLILVIGACGPDSALLEGSAEVLELARKQAEHFDVPAVVHLIALCDAAARNARGASTARALFDAALVRMCLSEHLADVAGLLTAGAAGAPSPPPGGAGAKKKETDRRPRDERPPGPAVALSGSPPTAGSRPSGSPPPGAAGPSGPEPGIVPASTVCEVKTSTTDEELWPTVVRFAERSPADQARIRSLGFRSFDGRTLRLGLEDDAPAARFISRQTENLVDLVRRATGRGVRVEVEADAVVEPRGDAAGPGDRARTIDEVRSLPLVQEAMDLFGAVVTDVADAAPDLDAKGDGDDV